MKTIILDFDGTLEIDDVPNAKILGKLKYYSGRYIATIRTGNPAEAQKFIRQCGLFEIFKGWIIPKTARLRCDLYCDDDPKQRKIAKASFAEIVVSPDGFEKAIDELFK